jgi:hypothetical protein
LDAGCLYDLSTQHDPWRASTLACRVRTDDDGLLGALESVDLIFKLGNVLLSLGQGAIATPPRSRDWRWLLGFTPAAKRTKISPSASKGSADGKARPSRQRQAALRRPRAPPSRLLQEVARAREDAVSFAWRL